MILIAMVSISRGRREKPATIAAAGFDGVGAKDDLAYG